MMESIFLTHGGAGSRNEYSDGTLRASQRGSKALADGLPLAQAVCSAINVLENDGRFNAGIGSHPREDGSIQMDAALMTSSRRFGAVAVIEGFKNPIDIALAVSQTPQSLLAGRGATEFAEKLGFTPYAGKPRRINMAPTRPTTDTVGCVAWDGTTFCAGLSTGGTGGAPAGRVGDVPLIGCGLYAGPLGAIAATGHGESIAMNMTAFRGYQLIESGRNPDEIVQEILSWFTPTQDIGIILVSQAGGAGGSNRSMAWSNGTPK